MFDVLIREAAARFGLGDKARELLQIVLAYMTNKDTGGLAGFLEKFKAAGMGPLIQSWLGNTVSAKPITNSQIEQVLGSQGGLLDLISARLNAPRDNITSAVGYLLPALVAKLTPNGSMPGALPADVTTLIGDGRAFLSAPVAATAASSDSGIGKWIPWIIGAVAVLLALSFCSKKPSQPVDVPMAPASVASEAASEPALLPASEPALLPASEPAMLPASEPASEPAVAVEPAASAPASAAEGAPEASITLQAPPEGASVFAGDAHGIPLVQVFFDVAKTDVAAEFADKAKPLVDYLNANPNAKAIISGFNDPTGDPVKNAELSKNRAIAVQEALKASGLAEDRLVLEKPADTSDTGATNAASRRVDVTIRH